MKYWIMKFGDDPVEYNGVIPQEYDFQVVGINWFIFLGLSPNDAAFQAEKFIKGIHPDQKNLNQICRTIRVLAAEGNDQAEQFFKSKYPPRTKAPEPKQESKPNRFIMKLEAIGHESQRQIRNITRLLREEYKAKQPWVAEIIGTDPRYKFKRLFLPKKVDYRESYKNGDRGVFYYYELSEDKIYEVNEFVSKRQLERYYCRIENKQVVRLSEKEVIECLKRSVLE